MGNMRVSYTHGSVVGLPQEPIETTAADVPPEVIAARAPVTPPSSEGFSLLWGCTSQPQFGDATFISSGKDVKPGDIFAPPDGATGGDAGVSPDGGRADLPPDAITVPDTPIDIPPQPKLCTPQVMLAETTGVIGITAGETASCATLKEGQVKCWGKLTREQDSKLVDLFSSPTPKAMDGFKNIAQTSLYLQHLCARDTFGQVWCMGQNVWGQLGDGNKQTFSAKATKVEGLANIMQVATGGFHSCALDTSGEVYCWGHHVKGAVGIGTPAPSVVTQAQKLNFPGTTYISSLALGDFHSCAIHEGGAIYCWGYNNMKQIALPSASDKVFIPTFVDKSGYRIAGGTDFSCRVDKDCYVSCAGAGGMGQLGNKADQLEKFDKDGQVLGAKTFLAVKSLTGISTVSANGQRACAVTQSGALYCWGDGIATPEQINGLAPVVQVAVGVHHSCALVTNGEVYCWGENGASQLGDGTTQNSATPVKVTGL